MQVLIVKTSSMGDILHMLPSLTDAMRAIPNIRFDWVVEEEFVQIPYWHKAVNHVFPVAIRRWRKAWFSAPIKAERKAFRKVIQAVHYDIIIDAQGLLKSALLVVRLARGIKHGMDLKTVREPLASLFYNRRHHIAKRQHAVERSRELFAKSLGYCKPVTYGDYAISHHFMHRLVQNNTPYLVFLYATTCDDKRWPETHWRELISLLSNSGMRIKLLWGTQYDEARAKRLAKGFNYTDVLPHMNLNDVVQYLAGAAAVVSVDTGLSHLTAALDRPNIILYGPTDPSLIGGYGENQYICRPEHSSQLSNLSASVVFMQLKVLLAKGRSHV